MSYETLYARKMYYLHLISQILFEINTAIHVATSTYLDFFLWMPSGLMGYKHDSSLKMLKLSVLPYLIPWIVLWTQQIVNSRLTIKEQRKKTLHFVITI